MRGKLLSIVFPVYNGADTMTGLVEATAGQRRGSTRWPPLAVLMLVLAGTQQ